MKYRSSMRLGYVAIGVAVVAGCQTAYYAALEQVGYHKRDLLVSRVEAARDSQEEAKEQFKSALEQFSSVVNFSGGELEAKYNKLSGELDASRDQAAAVKKRIDAVENVAEALFSEWESELDQYTNDKLRQKSAQQLQRTRDHYRPLITAMRRAESKMQPVLTAFNDQVLFLKHNLNAQAVASLKGELASVQTDIAELIREMESSIAEADEFIKTIDAG